MDLTNTVQLKWVQMYGSPYKPILYVMYLIEVLELVKGDVPVAIQVHDPEPVLYSCGVTLVLFRQQKPDKVEIRQFLRCLVRHLQAKL